MIWKFRGSGNESKLKMHNGKLVLCKYLPILSTFSRLFKWRQRQRSWKYLKHYCSSLCQLTQYWLWILGVNIVKGNSYQFELVKIVTMDFEI